MDTTTRAGRAAAILERSVCLVLERHYLGNHRSVSTEAVVQEAGGDKGKVDASQVRSTKRLVDSAVLNPAMKILDQVQARLRHMAVPAHNVFGPRCYLLPIAAVEDADAYLRQAQEELAVESALIVQRYQAAVDEQRARLGGLFDASQYPSLDDVSRAFRIGWSYVSFAAPERLESVGPTIFRRAQEQFQAKLADAFEEVRLARRAMLQELIGDLLRRLEPGANGQRKALRDTALDDLNAFLANAERMDITDDAELAGMTERLRAMLAGRDVEALRDSADLRQTLLADARQAAEALGTMVRSVRRGIDFGEAA